MLIGERPQGTFSRQLFLGDTLDASRIDARYTDGVLTLKLPIAARAKPRRVPIAAGNASAAIDVGAGIPKDQARSESNGARLREREPVSSAV